MATRFAPTGTRPQTSAAPSAAPGPGTSNASARPHALGTHARQAIAICTHADRLAAQAEAVVGIDDDRLFALLEQREQMLLDLGDHMLALQHGRPSADDPLFAVTERIVDDADRLISDVCEAVSRSQRATMALAMRVSTHVDHLRDELAAVRRAGKASIGYAPMSTTHQVDRLR